jgi:hypothetical protein
MKCNLGCSRVQGDFFRGALSDETLDKFRCIYLALSYDHPSLVKIPATLLQRLFVEETNAIAKMREQ